MDVDVRNIICFTLNCADLARSVAFYTDALGRPRSSACIPGRSRCTTSVGATRRCCSASHRVSRTRAPRIQRLLNR